MCKKEQHHIIKSEYDGNDIFNKANALYGQIGINSTTEQIQNRFFWYGMVKHITTLIFENVITVKKQKTKNNN